MLFVNRPIKPGYSGVIDSKSRFRNLQSAKRHPTLAAAIENPGHTGQSIESDPIDFNQDPDGDGQALIINLRFPGQYYDGESGLFYGGARYWDPRLGRAITADRRSVGKHVELMLDRMNAPKLLRSVGVTMTPDVNAPPLELNPYTYVANNPLGWTDPTGEGIVVPIVIIGGACFTMYCTIQAKNYCQAAYPSTGNPDTDRKRVKCFSERVKFCATFGAYIMNPIGSGAATAGEEVGRRTCDECKQ